METWAVSHNVVKYVSVNSNSVGYCWHNCHTQSRYKRNNGDYVNKIKIICQLRNYFKHFKSKSYRMHTFSELVFTMWPNLSQNGWPPATHSFCSNDWKPVTVRKWGSNNNCAKLDITQHKSLPALSKNDFPLSSSLILCYCLINYQLFLFYDIIIASCFVFNIITLKKLFTLVALECYLKPIL